MNWHKRYHNVAPPAENSFLCLMGWEGNGTSRSDWVNRESPTGQEEEVRFEGSAQP